MSLKAVTRCGLALTLLAVLSVPAAAQGSETRGYVVGQVGIGASDLTSPFMGGSLGFNVTRDLQITGDGGFIRDGVPSFIRDDLAAVDRAVRRDPELQTPLQSEVKVPTYFVTAGLRYLVPTRTVARPYFAIGAGVAHLRPDPSFSVLGVDYKPLVFQASPEIERSFRNQTRPMATAGAGVAVTVASHVTFDVGYRYSATFIQRDYLQDYEDSPHSHNRIDMHRGYVGVGVAF